MAWCLTSSCAAGCVPLCAALNDYLSWKGVTPIIRDPWGHGVQILRPVSEPRQGGREQPLWSLA
jgi:hypothetical protein